MELPEFKTIIFSFVVFVGLFLLCNLIVYNMASEICDEFEIRPIRYEPQGLSGILTAIETTPENADAYGEVCVKHGDPSFWYILENLNYIIEKSQSEEVQGK